LERGEILYFKGTIPQPGYLLDKWVYTLWNGIAGSRIKNRERYFAVYAAIAIYN